MIKGKKIKQKKHDHIVSYHKMIEAEGLTDDLDLCWFVKVTDAYGNFERYDIYVSDMEPTLEYELYERCLWDGWMIKNWEEEKTKTWFCPETGEKLIPEELMNELILKNSMTVYVVTEDIVVDGILRDYVVAGVFSERKKAEKYTEESKDLNDGFDEENIYHITEMQLSCK